MGRRQFRNWWSLGAVAGLAMVVGWLLYLLWRSPRRDDLSTYGAFALPVTAVVVGWLAWAWRKGKVGRPADDGEALDHAADQLAAGVQAQWKKAAEERGLTGADPIRVSWGRPSLAMAGPALAAAASRRFPPLPGLTPVGEAQLASGQAADLHALYGGLRSGRLIIAGPPGSGKTGAAVLLVLDALRHRDEVPAEHRPKVPVPVLFTVQDWDPGRDPAGDWLTRKLQGTYPLLATPAGAKTAAALLASGRITVILDGLDEISPALRPVALRALSQQATFRLVILSRTSEIAAAAASQGILQGAAGVELNPVSPADAANYLERTQLDPAPLGWQELTGRIRADPGGPLSRALDNPLALTLVRDTCQAAVSIHEFVEFCDATVTGLPAELAAEAITDYLLDRVLPVAYAHHPGQPPLTYDLAVAQRTLTRIATLMNQEGARDLNWWQIPKWTPWRRRAISAGLLFALVAGVAIVLADGITDGLFFGLAGGIMVGFAGMGRDRPVIIGNLRLSKVLNRQNLVFGLGLALVAWLVAWLEAGLAIGLADGITVMLVVGLVGGVVGGLAAEPDSNDSLNPASSRRGSRNYGLVVGLAVVLALMLMGRLAVGLAVGLAAGLAAGNCAESLTAVQLAIEWRIPVRLMRFLKDAHSRNVLRAVGPSYQFRHARLQDRLAAAVATSRAADPASSAPEGAVTAGEADGT